jgi:CheY-like chemotaxis protein
MHAGSLAVEEASEGHGVSFMFNLPLRASATAANASDQSPDYAPDLAGLRVLVVDDEADARQLHATMLEQYGAQVTTAASVAEAMSYFTEARPSERPDLIVSDISMPGDDGYSLIRQVRSLAVERGGRVPAIALTGLTQVADRIRVLSAGFQMHLAKPVNAAELALALAMLAGRNGEISNGGSATNETTVRRVGRVTRAGASHAARENRKTTHDLNPPTR